MEETGRRGFTLIELLVVIAIIGVLASVLVAAVGSARENARVARAKSDIRSLQSAFEIYYLTTGEYPPAGDACSGCSNPCSSAPWNTVVSALQGASAMTAPPTQDPWGVPYCYDDNYREPNCSYNTKLWSSGPNGSNQSDIGQTTNFGGDDIGILISPPQC